MSDRLFFRRRAKPGIARIVFNMRPLDRPWGGGNWWLIQMVRHLRATGYEVGFDLDRRADCVVVVDPRVGGNVDIGHEAIAAAKDRWPELRCLHAVNEADLHRDRPMLDDPLAEINALADYTVFISNWLLDYHASRWFDVSRPHSVIHNGADPTVFHPFGAVPYRPGETLRLVTHHWSDNPRKGFDVYEQVDRLIAAGTLSDVELLVIGRWPASCEWRSARTFPPATGRELADLVRQGHVYLTASRFEGGGLHFLEGAACGLPCLYHEDGGGIVEVARQFGVGYRDDVVGAIAEMRERYEDLRPRALELAPSGDGMCVSYRQQIQRVLATR